MGAGLAIAAIAIGGAGLGLQMKGQYEAGKAAEAKAKSEGAWREYNAQIAERESRETQVAAAYEESKLRKGGERLKARQKVLYAKAGVTPEGSPLDVMEQTAAELEKDALMIRRGGQLGYQRFTAAAGLERMMGRSALLRGREKRRASLWGTAATGLTGASQLGYQYSQMGKGGGGQTMQSLRNPWAYE